MDSLSAPALAIYAGSNDTDEQAFEITKEAGGVAVGIGPCCPRSAMHRLPDVESFAGELSVLLGLLLEPRRELPHVR
jgi:trehalose-6-phosphatase